MKRKILFLVLVISVFLTSNLFAERSLKIGEMDIPLIDGASVSIQKPQSANARIASYRIKKPLVEVISYYKSFLDDNGFLVIAGGENEDFSAAVKKGDTMFTLKIYTDKDATVLQFIW